MTKAAMLASMDLKTARKYRDLNEPPSNLSKERGWITRKNPFEDDWPEIQTMLEETPGLQVKTIFEHLCRTYPGRYQEGQKRTLERKVSFWRATEGPSKEVYFPQKHIPGELGASDFTNMNECGITINGKPFNHLLYHFVLSYSKWESVSLCYSESFESLSEGIQNALWELGRAPKKHRSDRMSAAVKSPNTTKEFFTERYSSLLTHYSIEPVAIQARKPNENGIVEQRHYRLKSAITQELMLRGSNDFENADQYMAFVKEIVGRLNQSRVNKLEEDLSNMQPLPPNRIHDCKRFDPTVTRNSTISINNVTYSVPSKLIGHSVKVLQYSDRVEVYLGNKLVDTLARIQKSKGSKISYRHIIDWLVRKPGAFENYIYKEHLFPTSWFRIAYDQLKNTMPSRSSKEYLRILELSAKNFEHEVNTAIQVLYKEGKDINFANIEEVIQQSNAEESLLDVCVDTPELDLYDKILLCKEAICQ